jgi:hypothetical protein
MFLIKVNKFVQIKCFNCYKRDQNKSTKDLPLTHILWHIRIEIKAYGKRQFKISKVKYYNEIGVC